MGFLLSSNTDRILIRAGNKMIRRLTYPDIGSIYFLIEAFGPFTTYKREIKKRDPIPEIPNSKSVYQE
jgi:hypothetical protein